MTNTFWHPFDDGRSLGQRGSENGLILRDEEHVDGARITLERDTPAAPFAITCGIYGWMVHTRYFATAEMAQQAFEEMRYELANILRLIPNEDDPEVGTKVQKVREALKDFIKRFP